ncbi:hypothetical protein BS78_07G066700 [Paspalum vaginatum]|nr:hypothetical protein BS78_07G066700 [Paspalum vaginatum]
MNIGDCGGATPPPPPTMMRAPGSSAMAIGLMVMLISVSVGINFSSGGIGLPLSFPGVLAGAILVIAGVRAADVGDSAPVVPAVLDGARGLLSFTRRDLALVGLVLLSSAITAVSGEAGPVLCFSMFVVLMLGVYLIGIGTLGE